MPESVLPRLDEAPHVNEFNKPVVAEFRANGGRGGGMFEGANLLLLTTAGARSGRLHTTPLGFLKIDEQLLVVGSAAGAPRHPDWYRNVLAHPEVEVEPDFDVTTMADKLVEVHTWIRAQLRRVRIEADAYFAGQSSAGLSLRIRQYCLAFCTSLHPHHFGEEAVMFPSLEADYPELRESIQRLREEHRSVEGIRGELEDLIADISNANAVRFLAELDRMTKELEAHLDFEEESVIPAMAKIPFPPRAGSHKR